MRSWYAVAKSVGFLLLALGSVPMALSACTAGHTALGTTDSLCFRSLPPAADAVHRKGTFVGVHRLDTKKLLADARVRERQELSSLDDKTVCAVAFHGNFSPGQVEHAYRERHGRYAVVLVTARDNKVVASFVLNRLPLEFRHL